MIKYKKFISECIKKKYSESTITNQNLLYLFVDFRKNFLLKSFEKIKINYNVPKKEKDNILKSLKVIYKKRSKLNSSDEKKVLKYYKKFNIFLRLLKKDKKITNPLSYLYLGYITLKIKKINEIQKINFILKIMDKLSFEKKISFNQEEFRMLFELFKFENTCLKKISK